MSKNELPNLLNYTRSIVPSEGIFWAIDKDKRLPITVQEKTVLGTISNYSGVYKGSKVEREDVINKNQTAGSNNIQRIDSCSLPPEIDTFELEFTLKFLPNSSTPEQCNFSEFGDKLRTLAKLYKDKNGYNTLVKMYFARICNGSFLWRNRYGIERVIKIIAPFESNLKDLELDIIDSSEPKISKEHSEKLAPWIQRAVAALNGEANFFLIKVIAKVKIGNGQEIYPSQEFVESNEKSKTLFKIILPNGTESAAMHSQKIGNAIRTIDIWYPNALPSEPLAIEPYAFNKRKGLSARLPTKGKSDFYSYLMDLDNLIEALSKAKSTEDIPNEVHYTMAVLIRGGVFSGEKKEKKKEESDKE